MRKRQKSIVGTKFKHLHKLIWICFPPNIPLSIQAVWRSQGNGFFKLTYVLSPIISQDGKLLDGTSLNELISYIDKSVSPMPVYYTNSCVHPSICRKELILSRQASSVLCQRIRGIKANTSSRRPEELASLNYIETENPEFFAYEMMELAKEFGFKILGGC